MKRKKNMKRRGQQVTKGEVRIILRIIMCLEEDRQVGR